MSASLTKKLLSVFKVLRLCGIDVPLPVGIYMRKSKFIWKNGAAYCKICGKLAVTVPKSCLDQNHLKKFKSNRESEKKKISKWTPEQRERDIYLNYKRLFGISFQEYKSLKLKPCEICGSTKNVEIDHSHLTGKIRGVVCHKCNIGLGFLDVPRWFEHAREYLARAGHFIPW